MASDDQYLELSQSPVRFDAVSHVTNVFFDDSNEQVFAVRSGGVTGVVVKGPTEDTSTSFRMEDKGPVISIKFSPDQRVLAIQRCKTSVEFVNFLNGMDVMEYSQSCKGKNTTIAGFVWVAANEIAFITDHGVELFQVIPERRSLKSLKTLSVGVNWFLYCPQSKFLLLSTGVTGNSMQPLTFRQSAFTRLNKFDIELPVSHRSPRLNLPERDVTLAVVYGQVCIIVLRHQPRAPSTGSGAGNTSPSPVCSAAAEVVVYTMHKNATARKSHVLRLGRSGRFAINIVDQLIVVHHQASKTSLVFDIGLPSGEADVGGITFQQPITPPSSIRPFSLRLPTVHLPGADSQVKCELYSPNWVVFQPDIIIDARLGCLWRIQLCLPRLAKRLRANPLLVVPLLSNRLNGKPVLISELRTLLEAGAPLSTVARIFDQLNQTYRNCLDVEVQAQMAASATTKPSPVPPTVTAPLAAFALAQSDMYTGVFSPLAEASSPSGVETSSRLPGVLLEYLRSLGDCGVPAQHFLHELLIDALVRRGDFFQLHQLLQYQVVADSKPLACLLLSLENVYPAAHQLALDMLCRLSCATEEVVEVLLSKQQLLPALNYLSSAGMADQISARKFLEAARASGDELIFYSVFKFFEQRNLRLRNSPAFTKGEHCDQFVKYYMETFCPLDVIGEEFSEAVSSLS